MVKPSEPDLQGRDRACMIVEGGQVHCIDPLEEEMKVLSKRWTLLVIGVLGNEQQLRFNETKRAIPGITARALSDVLEALQGRRLVEREVDEEASPQAVRYRLTQRGRDLRRALLPLLAWAAGTEPGNDAPPRENSFGPVVPRLRARDLSKTRIFYEEHLGFELTGCHPDEEAPVWMELVRGAARLEFMEDELPAGEPLQGALHVRVPDALGMHEALAPVCEVAWGPDDQDYGWREFAVVDPDGYHVILGEPLAPPGAAGRC